MRLCPRPAQLHQSSSHSLAWKWKRGTKRKWKCAGEGNGELQQHFSTFVPRHIPHGLPFGNISGKPEMMFLLVISGLEGQAGCNKNPQEVQGGLFQACKKCKLELCLPRHASICCLLHCIVGLSARWFGAWRSSGYHWTPPQIPPMVLVSLVEIY